MITNLAEGHFGFTSNAFLVTGDRPVVVDPGNDFDVVEAVWAHTDDLAAIVLTHTHPDHVGNVDELVSAFGVDVWGYDPSLDYVDHGLEDGDTVTMGDHEYRALHTPGHKTDHICLFSGATGVLFAGDLVFANGGFGRTDLEEGDRETLIESIDSLLEAVGDEVETMHTGHGPSVTTNPRQDIELAAQAARMG